MKTKERIHDAWAEQPPLTTSLNLDSHHIIPSDDNNETHTIKDPTFVDWAVRPIHHYPLSLLRPVPEVATRTRQESPILIPPDEYNEQLSRTCTRVMPRAEEFIYPT